MNQYDRGDSVRLEAETKDFELDYADPTALVLRVKKPDGTVATQNWPAGGTLLTKDDVGRFHGVVTADQVGIWHYRFEASGALVAAGGHQFEVREDVFA